LSNWSIGISVMLLDQTRPSPSVPWKRQLAIRLLALASFGVTERTT